MKIKIIENFLRNIFNNLNIFFNSCMKKAIENYEKDIYIPDQIIEEINQN